ncbi:MAG: hypothetical protein J6S96_06775 [Muribaculaceae bacterium]|nr:hypothetical protein [Muribaculaceae bacterium]
MNRFSTIGAALLMLCLSVTMANTAMAQQLTRYEYWFDNNVGSRHAGSLSGSTAEINLDIDTDGLSDGLHVLHLRVKRSDGKYSSIMSSTFLKFITGRVTMVEYWVDNDRDNIVRLPGTPHSSGHGIVLNQMLDLADVSPGMHRLNYRGVSDGGTAATAVNSSYFLKRLDGTVSMVEYWVDDDRTNVVRLPGTPHSSGNGIVLNERLNMTAVSPGMHRLNYRGVGNGTVSTAIASSYFMKKLDGTVTMIEYWVDNDRDNIVRLPGTTASSGNGIVLNERLNMTNVSPGMHRLNFRGVSDGNQAATAINSEYFFKTLTGEVQMMEYWVDNRQNVTRVPLQDASIGNQLVYNDKFDLGNVSPGMHRLYYRGVSSGNSATAVGVTPVMVKSLYGHEEEEDVKVVKYSMTIDNEHPIVAAVSNPGKIVNITRNLDVHDLQPGQHTVTVQAWNSASMSVTDGGTFTVPQPSPIPNVNLMAQVNDGLVTLRFNTVPNDVKWKLIRIDANGAVASVDKSVQGCYPNEVVVNDNPYNGNYTYKARVYYIDANGAQKYINSNEVNVTVIGDKVVYGYIDGQVDVKGCNGYQPKITVKYSDGEEDQTNTFGRFMRGNIPVNTRLTITAELDYHGAYTFDTVEVVIKEGENQVLINGVYDEEQLHDLYTYDLQFASRVDFTPGQYMKFWVKNITRLPWHGRIALYSVKKAYLESHHDGETPDITPTGSVGAGSVADMPTYTPHSDYNYDYSNDFYLSPGESTEVLIGNDLSSMRGDKDEMYCFFVNSIDSKKREKPVDVNYDYNIKENPFEMLVEKDLLSASEQQVFWEEVEYAVDLVEAICRYTKKFDNILGDAESGVKFVSDAMATQVMVDAEHCQSYSQLAAKYPPERIFTKTYSGALYGSMLLNDWRDSIASLVRYAGGALKIIKGIKGFVDNMELANNVWKNYNAMETMAFAARKIIGMSESTFPFVKVMKAYVDVTEKSIQNILDLVDYYNQLYEYQDFIDDKFKFIIKINKKYIGTFGASTVKRAIDKVTVECVCDGGGGASDALHSIATYEPATEWDPWTDALSKHCYLKRTGIDKNYNGESYYSIKDMRMTIYWKNGRISYVPLRNGNGMQGNGVNYETHWGDRSFTITFNSKTRDEDHCADIIKLDDD